MAGFPTVIIISDNSALSALAEIGYVDLLPGLFGRITIPEAVQRECSHPGAPALLVMGLLAEAAKMEFWISMTPSSGSATRDSECRKPCQAGQRA